MQDERLITPVAECRYAHVFVPSTKFNPEGTYEIQLIFIPSNPDHKEFLGTIKRLHEESGGTNKSPIKEDCDVDGNKTGNYSVRFKSKFPIQVFDSSGQEMHFDRNALGNGSKVRVSFKPDKYTQNGGGLALYLNGVQVKEFVEYSGGGAKDFGFDEMDGGYNHHDYDPLLNQDNSEPGKDQPEDDLPF